MTKTMKVGPAAPHPPGKVVKYHVQCFYLRQVNEVNGGDNAFVRCVSVCLSVCVRAAAGQWELNANSSKTLKLRT